MQVKRTYKFRFYPDQQQEGLLARTFGCVRFVYNNILRYRTDAYYQFGENIGGDSMGAECSRGIVVLSSSSR